MAQGSAFDVTAPTFERHRSLPPGVTVAIRRAVLGAVGGHGPRLLDLGAGTGRIGGPFVAAGDDYVGVDRSFGMLRGFMQRRRARLVQADGERLPFRDASFDAVMLIQAFGGMHGWRRVLAEARRVLRPAGALVVGRTVAPADGVDARMRGRLAEILDAMGVERAQSPREDAMRFLERTAGGQRIEAAAWSAARSPRGFLERHPTGARFAALSAPVKDAALGKLATWAATTFGSLDAIVPEPYLFELRVFKFPAEDGPSP